MLHFVVLLTLYVGGINAKLPNLPVQLVGQHVTRPPPPDPTDGCDPPLQRSCTGEKIDTEARCEALSCCWDEMTQFCYGRDSSTDPIHPCDYPFKTNCTTFKVTSQDSCEGRNCCWDKEDLLMGPCYRGVNRITPKECAQIITKEREPCNHGKEVTERECEQENCCWDPNDIRTGPCYRQINPCHPVIAVDEREPCLQKSEKDCILHKCCWDPDDVQNRFCYRKKTIIIDPEPCDIKADERVSCDKDNEEDCERESCCWDPEDQVNGPCYRACDKDKLRYGECSKTCGIGYRFVYNECADVVRYEKCCYKPCVGNGGDGNNGGEPLKDLCRNHPTFNGQK